MGLDFSFTAEERLLRRSIRSFLESEVVPRLGEVREAAEKHVFPKGLVKRMGDQGLLGVPLPERYGGSGFGEVGYCIALEEISMVDASLATIAGAHTGICLQPVYLFANEDQRERYLPRLASGESIGAFALTEPQAGSDAANIATQAVKDGDEYVLNGQKIYVTNGDVAEIIMVSAVTDPALGARGGVTAFIVERGFPGIKTGRVEDKMGIRGSTTAQLFFEDCRVPEENVLGKVGEGFIVALTALDGGRVALAAGTAGGARRVFEDAVAYVKLARALGYDHASGQAVQFLLAEMATEIHHARLAAFLAAREVELYYHMIARGERVSRVFRDRVNMQAGMVKIFASEAGGRAIDRAVQIMRESGLEDTSGMELAFRDHIITEIYEGTNEIQRLIIARDLLRRGSGLW